MRKPCQVLAALYSYINGKVKYFICQQQSKIWQFMSSGIGDSEVLTQAAKRRIKEETESDSKSILIWMGCKSLIHIDCLSQYLKDWENVFVDWEFSFSLKVD